MDGEPHQVALLEMEALPAAVHGNAEKIIAHWPAPGLVDTRLS